MTTSVDMLRKLASGVHPGLPTGAPARAPAESQRFEELLAAARQGGAGFRSEPVRLARGSKIELQPEQLRRLGPAVDAAEAQGSHTLLAFIDGKGVVVDVASRTVSGIAKPGDGVVAGVDAVAVIPDETPLPSSEEEGKGEPAATATGATPPVLLPLPSTESIRNPAIARLLSEHHTTAAA